MGIIDGVMQAQSPAVVAAAQPTAQPQIPAQGQQQAMPVQSQPHGQGDQLSYSKVVAAAAKILYTPATMKTILAMIKKAPSPEAGLAQATLLIMSELMKQSNNTIPQAVRTSAAKEIMGLIAELAEKAGIIKNAAQAVRAASTMIGQAIMKAAKITPEQLRQAKPRANQFQPFVTR